MSLDHHDNPPTPDELIQYGRDDIIERMLNAAEEERRYGDGRAYNAITRILTGLGLARKRAIHIDDGA